jgi:hypothetical protein
VRHRLGRRLGGRTRSLGRGALAAVLLLGCATAALAAGVSFRSPTGNIRCSITKKNDVPVVGCLTLRPRRAADVFDGERSRLGYASRHGSGRLGFVLPYGSLSNGSVSAASPAIAASPAATSGPGRASPSAARAPTASLVVDPRHAPRDARLSPGAEHLPVRHRHQPLRSHLRPRRGGVAGTTRPASRMCHTTSTVPTSA